MLTVLSLIYCFEPQLVIEAGYPPAASKQATVLALLNRFSSVLNFALMTLITVIMYHLELTIRLINEPLYISIDEIKSKEKRSICWAVLICISNFVIIMSLSTYVFLAAVDMPYSNMVQTFY